ncbi:hypothetical protein [Synechococcus sp. NOUM97013]|uniref:hypothetical protein n=1 Tax=Synechococcus sp. NOUM97013 TaxID=1442555 RepID=UPI001646FF27|nr:hypothetical protein [Synechococcus sp. NOUM97013]
MAISERTRFRIFAFSFLVLLGILIALALPIGLTVIMGLIYCFDSGTLRCTYVFAWMFAYLGCSLLSALGAASMWNKASRLRPRS